MELAVLLEIASLCKHKLEEADKKKVELVERLLVSDLRQLTLCLTPPEKRVIEEVC